MDSNEALIRRWFDELWNKHRIEAIDEMLTEDVVAHGLVGGPQRGRDAFRRVFQTFSESFPDLTITPEQVVASGDMVACRFTCRGTHLGNLVGVAPSGRRVEFTGMTMARIQDGKIAEGWNVLDLNGMLKQVSARS